MPDPIPGMDDTPDSIDGHFAPRMETLEGKSLMFVSLGTPNSRELHEEIEGAFTDEFGVESVDYYEKSHFSRPLSDEDVAAITGEGAEAIIEGFALCGSCNSSSSVDAIAFENKDIPTVQIISEDFIGLNSKIANSYGYNELPIVAVPQDTKYKTADDIGTLVDRIKWSLMSMLTGEECLDGACSVDDASQPEPTVD